MEKQGFESKPKRLPKYITQEEIMGMLDKAKKDRYRNYILLLALSRTGLRVSEITQLCKRDIIDNAIIVRQGKGKKDRYIPLEKELGNLLGLYIDRMNPRDGLFPLSERQVRNIVYKYSPWYEEIVKGRKVKRYEVHPHTLRHSFAVHCLKNHMNIRNLQKILGHSSLTTTQVYLDVTGEDVAENFWKVSW